MSDLKPLLASPYDQTLANWPMYVSPKLDGIRVLIINGKVYSRSLKLIPNAHVQALFGRFEFNGLDGELIVGAPNAPDVYLKTYSGVMSKDGEPDVSLHLFDDFTLPTLPFVERLAKLRSDFQHFIDVGLSDPLQLVPQSFMASHDAAMQMYAEYLDLGFEGIMARRADGPYKFGRSTAKEGILLKHKPLVDSDAEVLSVFEQMQNNNVATRDELGHTKRSSHQENLVGKDTLGGFVARDIHSGVEFNVGIFIGIKDKDRKALWEKRDQLVGRVFKYTSLQIGVKERPRHPRWTGWRDPIDL